MSRAVIILEDYIDDDGSSKINIEIKFFKDNEDEGTDDKSAAHHLGVKMLTSINED